MHRDSKMLTLLALRSTKALLIACKELVDLPQGRILDAAVEKYAIEILGIRKVQQIQRAMRDPAKAALLTREPRADDAVAPSATTTARRSATKKPAQSKASITKKRVNSAHSDTKASPRVSFLRDSPDTDE